MTTPGITGDIVVAPPQTLEQLEVNSEQVEVTPELQELCRDFFKHVDDNDDALPANITDKRHIASIHQGKLTSTPETGSFEGEVIGMTMPSDVYAQLSSISELTLPCRLQNVLKHLVAREATESNCASEATMSPVIAFAFFGALRASDCFTLPSVRLVSVNPEDETESHVWFYSRPE